MTTQLDSPRTAGVIDLDAARKRLRPAHAWLLCRVCELAAGPYPGADARRLAAVHDRVMHPGRSAWAEAADAPSSRPPAGFELPVDDDPDVLGLTS